MMPNTLTLPPRSEIWSKTEYREQAVRAYRGNPFIEALPLILTTPEIVSSTRVQVDYEYSDRYEQAEVREHSVMQLSNLLRPVSWHVPLSKAISALIREGYVGRNPISPRFLGTISAYGTPTLPRPVPGSTQDAQPPAQALIGLSGMGKTRAVRAILRKYPQVVAHSEYKGEQFLWKQLIWLHLDCPPDGSLVDLCFQFFIRVDEALGTNYCDTYLKIRNTKLLAIGMAKVAAIQGLGLLVIDQLGNLATASENNQALMLKFVGAINSSLRVPTLLIGTEQATSVLQGAFGVARQHVSHPIAILERLSELDFAKVVKAFWKYEYLPEALSLTSEITSRFSMVLWGNPALFCILYQLANLRAIACGAHSLSLNLFQSVYDDCFTNLHPHLQALQQGKASAKATFDLAMAAASLPEMTKVATRVAPPNIWTGNGIMRPMAQPEPEGKIEVDNTHSDLSKSDSSFISDRDDRSGASSTSEMSHSGTK